jgi:hypothetical protein
MEKSERGEVRQYYAKKLAWEGGHRGGGQNFGPVRSIWIFGSIWLLVPYSNCRPVDTTRWSDHQIPSPTGIRELEHTHRLWDIRRIVPGPVEIPSVFLERMAIRLF